MVQLYTRDVISSVTTYEKNLRGFERVHLEPGETKEVSFQLLPRDFQLLNKDNHWVVEPGMFQIMIGASSEDIRLKKGLEIRAYGQASANEIIESDPRDFISASKNKSHILHVVDGDYSTTWKGEKGEYISFELAENAKVDRINVAWKMQKPAHTTRFRFPAEADNSFRYNAEKLLPIRKKPFGSTRQEAVTCVS